MLKLRFAVVVIVGSVFLKAFFEPLGVARQDTETTHNPTMWRAFQDMIHMPEHHSPDFDSYPGETGPPGITVSGSPFHTAFSYRLDSRL